MEQQDLILEATNYKLFCKHLNDVVEKFPNLSIKQLNGREYLKGILDIHNDESNIIGHFFIELHYTQQYPYRFPILFEVGGEIPNEADSHKYLNGSCCITVKAREILICKNGLHLIDFIENHAIAFFANHIHRKETKKYKNGDYGHGLIGPVQFYSELLKTDNKQLWVTYFKYVFRNNPFIKDRNKPCFCGSGINYKKCHNLIFNILREIGEEQVYKDFKLIIQ